MKTHIWLCVMTLCSTLATAATAAEPNIVVIYADDLGYGDLQCYNPQRGLIPTPHLDRLAAEGMRFTDAHSSSGVCSPSRYTLLTGRYHWRSRLQSGIVNTWEGPLIGADRLTIGSLAQQRGLRTACIGKWHLGWEWPMSADERKRIAGFKRPAANEESAEVSDEHRATWQAVFARRIAGGPSTRGFDTYFGTDVPNWPPFCFIDQDLTVGIPTQLLPAADFRDNRASVQGPAVAGWQLEGVLPALRDRAIAFLDTCHDDQAGFLLYLPLTSPHTPLAVNEPWRGASKLENACADLIMETDAVVGQVISALERNGQADNTLLVFTSDNGFAPYVGVEQLEARGHFPSGPLRGYKADAWEGGHRVPFVVRWPGVVEPGTTCDQLVHQADLLATFAEVLEVPLPDTAGEDSVSLMPLLMGSQEPVREVAVSCSIKGVPAVRLGRWKYIPAPGSGGWAKGGDPDQTEQLYDLAVDLGETTNLAASHPEVVAEAKAALANTVADGRSTPGVAQHNDVPVKMLTQLPASQPGE
jgi:arylsulfatase A